MVEASEPAWTAWDLRRPAERGLYWWRVAPRDIGGMVLQPEWTDELRSVGMGYGENENWPGFSHWNGYQRSVPQGTEWRSAAPEEQKLERWPVELSVCPFCAAKPKLEWVWGADGGGVFVGGRPYQATTFWIQCLACRFARTPHYTKLTPLVRQWNTRATTGER